MSLAKSVHMDWTCILVVCDDFIKYWNLNAIPIPALDGGRILILLIEKLIGRKVSTKVVENIIMASFVLLMLLFLYATYNDIVRLF